MEPQTGLVEDSEQPEEMTYRELKGVIAKARAAHQPDHMAEAEMAGKYTVPLATLLFALLGVPLGLKPARGGQSERFGVAISLFFLYYMLMRLGRTLAERGMLNALAAMAIPDLVFLGLAVWLFYRSATDTRRPGPRPGRFHLGPDRALRPQGGRMTLRPRLSPTIDRFLGGHFLGPFFVCLAAFTAAYLLGDIFDRFDDLMHYGGFGLLGLEYFVLKLPLIVSQLLPVAWLAGVLLGFALLNRTGEVLACQQLGISRFEMAVPVLLLAALISIADFAISETVVPVATREAKHLYQVQLQEARKFTESSSIGASGCA